MIAVQRLRRDVRGRGRIERFFRTINQMLLCGLPGYTPAGTPDEKTLLTLAGFETRLRQFILDEYHQRSHSETGVPPQTRWAAGGFLPRLPENLEQLDLLLLTVPKSRKVRQDGIHFQGLCYLDTTLAAFVGEQVIIRYDPLDMAEIRVFHRDKFLCRAICHELAGETLTLGEIIKARTEAAGVKLTPLAYVFRALPAVLKQYPLLNASLDDEKSEIVLKHEFHLGCATNTEEGLTVPILHHADRMTLVGVAREIARLSQAARDHKLSLDEMRGGTFTVTSTGAKGGVLATPILHHPQVAILGVHAITRKPAVVNEQIVIRDIGNLSLSMDHRVVDGAVGADFLYALVERLQSPAAWLTEGDLS